MEAPRQLRPRAAGRSSTRRWVWLAVMLQPSKLEFEAGGGVVCYSEKRLAVPKDLLPLLACSKGPAALPGVRVDCEHGRVCVAMVLLARGALDAAHDMVGDQDSPEATYVHAMIHRREGGAKGEAGLSGFSNSRYWFGNLGDHQLFPVVLAQTAALPGAPAEVLQMAKRRHWDCGKMVGVCEKASADPSDAILGEFCRAMQLAEWVLLFEFCAEMAAA